MKKRINVINQFSILTLVLGFSLTCFSLEIKNNDSTQDKTLKKFMQMGLVKSLSIQSQSKRMLQAEFKRKDAWAGLLPTVAMSAGRTYDRAESADGSDIVTTSTVSNSLKVSGNWILWDQTANYGKILNAKYDETSEQIKTEKNQQSFVYQVLDSYLDHLLLIKRKELLERYLDQS